MNTREMTSEYRLAHWAGIMRERQESGLNIKTYCRSNGIHENVYYYWQKKLREAAYAELSLKSSEEEIRMVPTGWSRIEAAEQSSTKEAGVTIEINDYHVGVSAGTDPELLAKICRMLKTL